MTSGDFAVSLGTIITGLALTVILAHVHELITNRHQVKWDWLTLLSAALVFMVIIIGWGISFRTLANTDFNPPLWYFAFTLGQIIPIYLAARAVLPDAREGEGVDLTAHYQSEARYLWTTVALAYILYLAAGIPIYPLAELARKQWLVLAQLAVMLPLILSSRRLLHQLLVPLIVILFCVHHLNERMFG